MYNIEKFIYYSIYSHCKASQDNVKNLYSGYSSDSIALWLALHGCYTCTHTLSFSYINFNGP